MSASGEYALQRTPIGAPGRVRSLWIDEALATESPEAMQPLVLREPVRADVCIVGGGYTGLWTAIRIRELDPSVEVCVVEASLCGSGASGRNGGMVHGWWPQLPKLVRLLGQADAKTLAELSTAAIDDIEDVCSRAGAACDFQRHGWLWAATTPAQLGAWDAAVEAAAVVGATPFRVLEQGELAERSGCDRALAGVLDRTAALVQPAALARALTALARELGVKVFERSPVRAVKAGQQVTVETTTDGVVRAERVVLALNAWMAHLPELRRFVAVLSSDVVATERLPDTVRRAFSLQRGLGVANSRLTIDYYRDTADGRVVFGSGGGTVAYGGRVSASFDHSGRQVARVARNLYKLLPALRDVPIARGWSGPVDRSHAGLPRFGRLAARDPRILYGIGYSGNGVAAAALGGRILASLALHRDDRWAAAGAALAGVPSEQFPPEPIRYLGARMIRAAVVRKEDAEDVGGNGTWLDRTLARLAPSGITGGRPSRLGAVGTKHPGRMESEAR